MCGWQDCVGKISEYFICFQVSRVIYVTSTYLRFIIHVYHLQDSIKWFGTAPTNSKGVRWCPPQVKTPRTYEIVWMMRHLPLRREFPTCIDLLFWKPEITLMFENELRLLRAIGTGGSSITAARAVAEIYDSEIIRNLACTQHQSHIGLPLAGHPTIPWLCMQGLHVSKLSMGRFGGMLYPWTVTYPISRCQWFVAKICMGIPWLSWYSGHLYYHISMYLNRFEEIQNVFRICYPKKMAPCFTHKYSSPIQGTGNPGLRVFITLGRFPATCVLLVWDDARVSATSSEWENI